MREKLAALLKKMRPGWRHLGYLAAVVLSVVLLWGGNRYAQSTRYQFDIPDQTEVATARVTEIWARDPQVMDMGDRVLSSVTVYFEAEFLSGRRAGATVGAQQTGNPFDPVQMREVQVGDKIMLANTSMDGGEKVWTLQEYVRTGPLLGLGVVFLALVLLFGGKKGVSTILSLGFTCAAVFAVFIPLILGGHNIYVVTLLVCLYIVLITLALVNGFNKKSLSAAVGCLGGLLVSGALVRIMDELLKLTGYVNEESAFLMYLNPEQPLDLRAIIFSGILIGATGAIMDVAVSMSSALAELRQANPEISLPSMLRSGMNIGRDVLGTMTNTLILAYIGGSLSLSLLLFVYSNSLMELLNRELIVVELLQSLVGCIGLICTIPLTCAFAAWIFSRKGKDPPAEGALAAGEDDTSA